ncbi:hypothetical protein NAL33_20530 [Xanthomonas oryzae pv. oryzae]|nr:hypothetical protein NAL33_20530 [Xanthomonas oryzae pv. oryzae]
MTSRSIAVLAAVLWRCGMTSAMRDHHEAAFRVVRRAWIAGHAGRRCTRGGRDGSAQHGGARTAMERDVIQTTPIM